MCVCVYMCAFPPVCVRAGVGVTEEDFVACFFISIFLYACVHACVRAGMCVRKGAPETALFGAACWCFSAIAIVQQVSALQAVGGREGEGRGRREVITY